MPGFMEFDGQRFNKPKKVDINHVASVLSRLRSVVLDTETNGLDWRVHHTVGYVLTWGPGDDDTVYLPIRHGDGAQTKKNWMAHGNLEIDKVLPMLREELMRADLRVIGHALDFDLKMMHNDDIHLVRGQPAEDTMINAFILDERQRSFSLDACCKFMGVQEKKGEALYKYLASKFGGEPTRQAQMQHYWRLDGDDPIGVDYAVGDGTSTYQLLEKQHEKIDPEEDLSRAWHIESRLIRPLHRMMMRGIRVDEERLAQVRKMATRMADKERRKLPKGLQNLEMKANKAAMADFFRSQGFTDWPLTPAKQEPSFTREWLMTNPPGQLITRIRKLEDLDSKFLKPMAEVHLFKGRIHANFNQTRGEHYGTKTARLSCDHPNLQAAHKRDDEMGSMSRSPFSPDKGKKWGDADYNQCEPRLLAHYGEVSVLLKGYLSDPPIDAHSAVAASAGIKRQAGKTLNQALITGAGRDEVIRQLDMPRRDAMAVMDRYFASMPEIKTFQRRAMAVMSQRGFVRCLMGHRGRTEGSRFDYKAVNKILQTGNAGVMKKSFADIDEYVEGEGDEVNLLNTVHDSFGLQFDEDNRRVYERALEIAQDYGPGKSVELLVPMPLDADEGANWAEATWGKERVAEVFKMYGEKYKS